MKVNDTIFYPESRLVLVLEGDLVLKVLSAAVVELLPLWMFILSQVENFQPLDFLEHEKLFRLGASFIIAQ